jgi:general secretion pathway protein A
MYLSHYHLKRKPFQISPDPQFLWLGETHKEALATLVYGIHDNRGLLLLVGDVGTGKTTLINRLLNSLDENIIVATVSDPGLEKLDFFNFLARAFKFNKKFSSKGDFLVYFIHFLRKAHAANKKVLLIIDEAQRLTHEMLEEIRLMSNIEKQDKKLLNIFLVGQDELNEKLMENRNRALMQRITTRYSIGPLKKSEIAEYIKFRLSVAGTSRKIFTSGAIRGIISFSECYPRLINTICDHALLTGYTKGKMKINSAIIKDCTKDLQIPKENWKQGRKSKAIGKLFDSGIGLFKGKPGWKKPIYMTLLALLLILAGYYYFPGRYNSAQYNENETVQRLAELKESPVEPVSSQEFAEEPEIAVTPKIQVADQGNSPVEQKKKNATEKTKIPFPSPGQRFIINFSLDSNEFSDDTYKLLGQLVEIVLQYPDTEIIIKGYTDSSGDYNYNKHLSRFRAGVVKSYFIGQGVSPVKLKASGMGPENPVASNDTAEGRRANRRVEIELKLMKPLL